MDEIIGFLKNNIVIVGLILTGVILLFVMLLVFFRRSKKRSKKNVNVIKHDQEFDKAFERFEKTYYKKCRKCGGNVPVGDNICQNCGEMPN